jgi:hypothetical protein
MKKVKSSSPCFLELLVESLTFSLVVETVRNGRSCDGWFFGPWIFHLKTNLKYWDIR